jgi:protein-S-isoprenylcysteine O-methyltransferase Ste14
VLALTAVYLSLGIVLWQPIAADINSDSRAVLSIAGSLFYFPGVALYLWGYRSLGKMFGVSSSSVAELYQDHRLVVDGPYSIVRHPMYLGVLLVALGALLIFRTWAMVMFAPSSCVVIVRARREESLLEVEFGEEWRAYEDRVPAWIPIPRFKSRTVQ